MQPSTPTVLLFTFKGDVISKKNKYKPGRNGGIYLSGNAKDDIEVLVMEMMRQRNAQRSFDPLEGYIQIEAVFYCTKKQDLDNRYTTLQDAIQKAKIIKNDADVGGFCVVRHVIEKLEKPFLTVRLTSFLEEKHQPDFLSAPCSVCEGRGSTTIRHPYVGRMRCDNCAGTGFLTKI